jgi:hypothetical protein
MSLGSSSTSPQQQKGLLKSKKETHFVMCKIYLKWVGWAGDRCGWTLTALNFQVTAAFPPPHLPSRLPQKIRSSNI